MLCYKALNDQTVAFRVILLATLVTHGPSADLGGKPSGASISLGKKKLENMPPYYVVIMGVINNMTLINCHPIMLMNKNSGVYMFPVSNLNEVLKWCIIWWWGKAEKVPCLLSGLMCFLMRTSLLSQCCWICTPQTKVRMDFQCFNRNIDQQRHTYVCIYTHTKSS